MLRNASNYKRQNEYQKQKPKDVPAPSLKQDQHDRPTDQPTNQPTNQLLLLLFLMMMMMMAATDE
jgi:hypothetical protein